jgi:hypothetical protein
VLVALAHCWSSADISSARSDNGLSGRAGGEVGVCSCVGEGDVLTTVVHSWSFESSSRMGSGAKLSRGVSAGGRVETCSRVGEGVLFTLTHCWSSACNSWAKSGL